MHVMPSPNNTVWTKSNYLDIPLKVMLALQKKSQILPGNIIVCLFESDIKKKLQCFICSQICDKHRFKYRNTSTRRQQPFCTLFFSDVSSDGATLKGSWFPQSWLCYSLGVEAKHVLALMVLLFFGNLWSVQHQSFFLGVLDGLLGCSSLLALHLFPHDLMLTPSLPGQ